MSALKHEDVANLERPITMEETKFDIDLMGDLKAPGPDGFNALFYKKCWNIVGGEVHEFVSNAFNRGSFEEAVNQTLIVLIPKVTNLSTVIVNRLKPLISDLINSTQVSFVPKWHMAYIVFMGQEATNFFKVIATKRVG